MQAQYQDHTLASVASPLPEAEHHEAGHFLYQSATALAMLILLISFWSC